MRGRKLVLGASAVLLALGGVEVVLRIAGFSWQPVQEQFRLGRLQGGIPTGEVVFDRLVTGLFSRDPLLFWKPVPGRPPFNAQGLRDDEDVPEIKVAGEFRILALGDSCTFLGEPFPWTDLLESRLLAGLPPDRRVRVLNAAVPAWSSLQGRRFLEARGISLHPDLVTVYFGWNDHWRATVKPDAEFAVPGTAVAGVQRALSHARLYQALAWLLKGSAGDSREKPFRVPATDFEANLQAIAARARTSGAACLFITAPSTLAGDRVPDYLFVHGFVTREGERVETIHARYADIVRQTAATTGCVLVDAARDFDSSPDRGRAWMRDDGIHLTAAGIERMADLVAAAIRDRQLLE